MKKSLHEAAAEAAQRSEGATSALTLQVRAIAERLRCTEGQIYSMAIGLTVATLLAITGGVPLGRPPVAAADPGLVATPEEPGTTLPETPDPVAPEVPPSSAPPALPPSDTLPVIPSDPVGPLPDVPTDAPTEAPTEEPTEGPIEDSGEGVMITKSAWYSTTGPVDTVPEEALPVAIALGQPRNLSVVTLEGPAAELVLEETDDSQTSPETALIRLCPLVDGETYEQGTGQTVIDAPAYDCAGGVDGARDSAGRWTFPVSVGANRRSFALVPQSATPLDLFTIYLAAVPALGFAARLGTTAVSPS